MQTVVLYSNISPSSYRFKFSAQLGETNACLNQDEFASQPFPRKHEDCFLYKPSALLFYVNLPKAKTALFVQVLTKDNRNGYGMRGSGKEERNE